MINTNCAALLLAGAAFLAPPAAAQDWAGFYVGLNAGYLSGGDGQTGLGSTFIPQNAVGYPTLADVAPDGFFGGLEAGYNWQFADYVLGIAADVQIGSLEKEAESAAYAANLIDDVLVFEPYTDATASISQDINWLATFRGRVGRTFHNSTLAYFTGGLAVASVSYDASQFFPPFLTYPLRERKTQLGWTVGVGAEQRLRSDWSLKAEYLYVDLGGRENLIGVPEWDWATAASFAPVSTHIGRIGINRRF